MPERDRLRLHVEDPALFREAVAFTAAETQFTPRLVEKDYFCSVILRHLAGADAGLVFRGGTCLAKVHAGLYRLSEDLDFLIPTRVDASRGDRRRRGAETGRAIAAIDEGLPALRVTTPFTGANDSRQYAAVVSYESLVSKGSETIKVEVGLREPLLTEAVEGEARTLLLDPISGKGLVGAFRLPCLARQEAMAEKLRAALSRREVAIRDFFDVDHALRVLGPACRMTTCSSWSKGSSRFQGMQLWTSPRSASSRSDARRRLSYGPSCVTLTTPLSTWSGRSRPWPNWPGALLRRVNP